ncbi:uncharacterized protein VP01_1689g5 [Puccinia sorghi]|uniref:CCHC-type domain-containing protein n=1 Tax=Puccinia sorghi TaxID=27349 RepID=A0A0L6VHQ7_9BASI|nr:uncharacterized protein VP01_1689g5 [Puccinia sorghi]
MAQLPLYLLKLANPTVPLTLGLVLINSHFQANSLCRLVLKSNLSIFLSLVVTVLISKSTFLLPPGKIPNVEMLVNAINGRCHERYEPPHCRSTKQPNNPTSGKIYVEKATFYCGKVHSDSLMERFGYACLYCKETGHWYSNCDPLQKETCSTACS